MRCLILIITLLLMSCAYEPYHRVPPLPGETIRYYDTQGKYTGKSVQHGNTIRYYDKHGKYIGSGKNN